MKHWGSTKRMAYTFEVFGTKYILHVSLVTQHLWVELALWYTSTSALQGWGFRLNHKGLRLVTPWVGLATGIYRT